MALLNTSDRDAAAAVLQGGGEMGERMRAFDWARTPLGPVASWPLSLRTCVRIVLTSRQPMFVWWGDDLINLYNDPYKSIVGGKHPQALGQPARVVWREIWDQVGPRAETAIRRNEGTYDEALLLIMERHGYEEETYYTFSYSPVPNDQGGTGGIICANTDDTRRIISERQLGLLRDLASNAAQARSAEAACARAAESLATNPRDLPFALLYLVAESGRQRFATLVSQVGIEPGHPAAPATVPLPLDGDGDSLWPLKQALNSEGPVVFPVPIVASMAWANLDQRSLPMGAWQRPPKHVVALPIARAGESGRAGVLVAGLNPYRLFDESYRGFIELVGRQISAAIGSAEAYEQERKRAEALAEIDRAKTAFFSNVSHEFRTPLTLMLGPTEDALDSGVLAGESLKTVHRNQLRLLKLVNNLLDFSRIEAGRAQATYLPTDLGALTIDLASSFRAAIERAGLTFTVTTTAIADATFVDRDMWERIVLNLLSNAFKFTLQGSIAVTLQPAGDVIELTVTDTGCGIPAEELPHIFERFHRVQGGRSRTHEGSGIGLALVHELVRLHGGTALVRSTVGRGTTFTVRVPQGTAHLSPERMGSARAGASGDGVPDAGARAISTGDASSYVEEALRWLTPDQTVTQIHDTREGGATREAVPAPSNGQAHTASRVRILVADDNADMRDYVQRILGERWTVEVVGDGNAALTSARTRRPDLVLTDVMMPGLDGFGLLRALRAEPTLRDIPVVILSARAGDEARVEGLQAGADDYLVKPFSARELMARIDTHVRLARARTELEIKTIEAESASQAKDEFLAMLGHELRNPLAPISTALQLMELRGGEIFQKERTIIDRQVKHLVRLVDDLLEVSRIARGKISLERGRTDLGDILARALEMASPLIEQREHHLSVDVTPGLVVSADPGRLAQAFSNLLNNAAKYTPAHGSIRVTARRERGEIVVMVKDSGIGIRPEMLPRIFDLFVQERQSLDRSQGGLGLGLTIVRSLILLHGGSVEARSEGAGRGAEIVVRLPVAAETEVTASASEVPATRRLTPITGTPRAKQSRRILVVDDNEDAVASLADALQELGHAVETAHDGAAALGLLQQFTPDIAFLDIGLPVMDGYELARRIREDRRFAATRLVAVTGYGQKRDKLQAAEAGFDAHLVKPVDLRALEKMIALGAPAR
jgi:signal transduction histidine kinase